jgi:hypothetical protein
MMHLCLVLFVVHFQNRDKQCDKKTEKGQTFWKNVATTVAKPKKNSQNIKIKAQFESQKHQHLNRLSKL